ncbi:MAG: GNAT family protein [Chloroflexi bacterium]|nr:GNAT family protein [Chloroflexota bacterium]
MEIELRRGRLRPWRRDDAASVVKHANNRNVSRYLRDAFPFPYTETDATTWLRRNGERDPTTNFAIEVDGEAVGSVGLRPQEDVYRRTAEIGYWLGEAHWGRGIATEVVQAMTAYGFERLDLVRIEADVFAPNAASARVLAKNGYRCEGRLRDRVTKDGRTMDALLYSIVRSDWAGER